MRTSLKLAIIVALSVIATFAACGIGAIAGASSRHPKELKQAVSPEAAALITRAYEGIDPARLLDHHVHVVGLGAGGTGAWVNPGMQSWLSPVRRVKFSIYADASGIEDLERADQQYMERLTSLVEPLDPPGRYQLLAFDWRYGVDGKQIPEHSEFYVPNEYVVKLAGERPDLFVPAGSVHPYRPDALAELDRVAASGATMIKWLPNAMGIDPADPRLDPFYAKVAELGLAILTHAGEEAAVEAEEDQKLGNPLRLRRPLDAGVRIVVAHCASLGDNVDLDSPAAGRVENFDLFMRLMEEPRYEGLVFGEISATTQTNRLGKPLTTLLRRTDLHHRLVSGSDYPLPAINILIRTGHLVDDGYLTDAEREALNEIYDFNPMLFDFVLKRTVAAPETGERFAAEVFHEKVGAGPDAAAASPPAVEEPAPAVADEVATD